MPFSSGQRTGKRVGLWFCARDPNSKVEGAHLYKRPRGGVVSCSMDNPSTLVEPLLSSDNDRHVIHPIRYPEVSTIATPALSAD